MLIDAGGFRCNVIDEGEGTPVVWLHGLGGTWRDFETQLDRLADRYRCIVPELRGHGRTPSTPGPLTTASLAADVHAVLQALEVDRAVVVGLSLGGLVAQTLAGDHPEVVSGLVLVSTSSKVPLPVAFFLRVAAARIRSKGIRAAIDLLERGDRRAGKPTGAEAMSAARAAGTAWERRDFASNDPDVLADAMLALVGHDEHARLPQIEVPALVVVGDEDPAVTVGQARELAAAIPGALFEVVAGGGHMLSRDHPDELDRLLTQFVDQVTAAHA
ncbi:MAG: alpha/beta hydrolase [Actinomycetota bacterium]|nr:alpha/beta hydrolase [Actinomycetota bacterium]